MLYSFLREVSAESALNQMDIHNLSTVFAPTLLRPAKPDFTNPAKAFNEVRLCQLVIKFLLEVEPEKRIVGITTLINPGSSSSSSGGGGETSDVLDVVGAAASSGSSGHGSSSSADDPVSTEGRGGKRDYAIRAGIVFSAANTGDESTAATIQSTTVTLHPSVTRASGRHSSQRSSSHRPISIDILPEQSLREEGRGGISTTGASYHYATTATSSQTTTGGTPGNARASTRVNSVIRWHAPNQLHHRGSSSGGTSNSSKTGHRNSAAMLAVLDAQGTTVDDSSSTRYVTIARPPSGGIRRRVSDPAIQLNRLSQTIHTTTL